MFDAFKVRPWGHADLFLDYVVPVNPLFNGKKICIQGENSLGGLRTVSVKRSIMSFKANQKTDEKLEYKYSNRIFKSIWVFGQLESSCSLIQ